LDGWKGIRPVKNMGDDGGGHCLVRMEWCPAGWLVCLPLLIFLCTVKSQKFSSGTGSPGWSWKQGRKTVVVVWCWMDLCQIHVFGLSLGRVWMSRSKVMVNTDRFPPHWKCILKHLVQIT